MPLLPYLPVADTGDCQSLERSSPVESSLHKKFVVNAGSGLPDAGAAELSARGDRIHRDYRYSSSKCAVVREGAGISV
ncbi:hypothetical protein H6G00_03640 [Leptolyngbya sp. FACHB-541]|uniref:hypothetical protein n=1 Tax=Leptolyngbya sp. FACHB-541 TaxID=2692810 RepID=UPI001687655F|nr:hypothetical protein [Leptolyngbya sp. FACHB-541]MBD1995718.1 hypothetical protein [Leptolyngbya sp. FACHB-541]